MAYQKQIYQDGVTEYTEELFEHMDDGIFGAYPVQLIAISDTAPSQCVENDKYYNTSTKKIYTATGTNTWGTNGETPLEDTSYWLISENGNYAWDGTDLVSIGGGKAEVVISDTEPSEGKLWVGTGEIQVVAGKENLVNIGTLDNTFGTNIVIEEIDIDKSAITDNKFIDNNGDLQNSSVSCVTDFTNVNSNTNYTLYIGNTTSYTVRILFYDSSKTKISYVEFNVIGSINFVTPSNCAYIRFQLPMANKNALKITNPPSIVANNDTIYSKPDILFSDISGQFDDIVLNQNKSKYYKMEIYYLDDQNFQNCMTIDSSNNMFQLQFVKSGANRGSMYFIATRFYYSGNTIKRGATTIYNLVNGVLTENTTADVLKITKILGYR